MEVNTIKQQDFSDLNVRAKRIFHSQFFYLIIINFYFIIITLLLLLLLLLRLSEREKEKSLLILFLPHVCFIFHYFNI